VQNYYFSMKPTELVIDSSITPSKCKALIACVNVSLHWIISISYISSPAFIVRESVRQVNWLAQSYDQRQ